MKFRKINTCRPKICKTCYYDNKCFHHSKELTNQLITQQIKINSNLKHSHTTTTKETACPNN